MKEKIINLIKRNSPVFIIGLVTAALFIIIIIISQSRSPTHNTDLVEVDKIDLIAPHTYIYGSENAPVTVVEFSDFNCPACATFHPIMTDIADDYPQHIRWAFRHFPLSQNNNSVHAAEAAQAAGEQGKFWEYAKLLYESRGKLEEKDLKSYADLLGLDTAKFNTDYTNQAIADLIQNDVSYARQIGINATPTFFVNGKAVEITDLNSLRKAIEQELEKYISIKQQEADEEQEIEAKNELIQIETNLLNIIDEKYGKVEISYNEEGFTPRDTDAIAGQIVVWTNNSDSDITFVQLAQKFDELKEPFVIKSGESFEFRLKLRTQGMWTYRAEGNNPRGSILIYQLPDNLQEMLPKEID